MSSMSAVINAIHPVSKISHKVTGRSDRLFAAFDEAIAQGDLELAEASLRLVEVSIMLRPADSPAVKIAMDELVASHTYLWTLRHPEALAA
ncbi:MAG: hypothetical protein K2X74_03230 [Acetobacteraceae bacterium]|nr:hypothetical protein [Acetobacteraceae bacterium]